jgi:hypothetical protein
MKRKYKVETVVTQYMWAESRADAAKFMDELIRKGRLRLDRDGQTEVKFCFTGGDNFVEAPEDISETRNPVEQPRPLDWIEIDHGGDITVALLTKLSRRKAYYFVSSTREERSIDIERWQIWGRQHTIHPSYEKKLPPFIIDEAVREHEARGLLSGMNATPDSSLILEILDSYGYRPDDYEVENGYWAESVLDQALSERILSDVQAPEHTFQDEDGQRLKDFSVAFSQELPSFDDLEQR